MRGRAIASSGFSLTFFALLALHYPMLRLPYFWDEAGYYIPAALDFCREGLLIPNSTLPTGHTPLVVIYLGLAWRVFGFSPLVTRTAMILVAAATVVTLYELARRVVGRETATWSAVFLALSPMFFAQSSLVYLDLPAALFTTLAVLRLLEGRMSMFAVTASLAVLSKETAVVLLPVAWVYYWSRARQGQAPPRRNAWIWLTVPLAPLIVWTLYYHHVTGFWTGNAEYLQYNLYSTVDPGRIFWSLWRRLYEVFIGGFNWLLVAGAALGVWWSTGRPPCSRLGSGTEAPPSDDLPAIRRDFLLLAGGLGSGYVLMHSVVGGAILPRYLLPIFPMFFLVGAICVWRLPKTPARVVCGATAACFVGAWFINPPYPFPFEDNLAYADFVRLHQKAAALLESQPGAPRILTAWPASDELTRPFLGYVRRPLRVTALEGFTARDFHEVRTESFDLLYLYSRKWEPPDNWLTRFAQLEKLQSRYFGYAPQIGEDTLVAGYRLRLVARFEKRGQWAKIYVREPEVRSQDSEDKR